jgi:hypothetical protein
MSKSFFIASKLPAREAHARSGIGRVRRKNFAKACGSGTKMAFGTDGGVYRASILHENTGPLIFNYEC